MGKVPRDALRLRFDRAIQLKFYGLKSPPLPKRPQRASRSLSWGRTRPVTVAALHLCSESSAVELGSCYPW